MLGVACLELLDPPSSLITRNASLAFAALDRKYVAISELLAVTEPLSFRHWEVQQTLVEVVLCLGAEKPMLALVAVVLSGGIEILVFTRAVEGQVHVVLFWHVLV